MLNALQVRIRMKKNTENHINYTTLWNTERYIYSGIAEVSKFSDYPKKFLEDLQESVEAETAALTVKCTSGIEAEKTLRELAENIDLKDISIFLGVVWYVQDQDYVRTENKDDQ